MLNYLKRDFMSKKNASLSLNLQVSDLFCFFVRIFNVDPLTKIVNLFFVFVNEQLAYCQCSVNDFKILLKNLPQLLNFNQLYQNQG